MTDADRPDRDSFREKLIAYLDGELPAAEAREVEERLARDPEMRREAEAHRAVSSMLDAYADEPVPPGFSQRVLGEARASDARPRLALLRGGASRRAAVAAAIVLAVGAGVLVGRKTAP